ncbi:glycosyltransferase [Novosphingobium album (ex Liu et al. 2023)]|uniref:Glycosyltransferase family 2 protein n=1 Tax=Novosphingobium album (ex Liu et al. 2023) TaxID=3031130 RepID=A0ABT5WQH0_9SPHN|nr:glycosyltransferase family 2 protein [Novosphingobium album (ex Liu et al. 2023)]MDE8652295.1 glycosyltransferase family 2 protein [Novosphingobium album (ex Liu et al. 2023)]
MTVTIAIKALNEGATIRDALTSARAAADLVGGKVVLADSVSSDDTIAIARSMGVRIVQLAEPMERCCGAGAQLAFQAVDRDYFYLMDGDMRLVEDFLPKAIAFLNENPNYAGVGGEVIESVIANQEFQIRSAAMRRQGHRKEGQVDRLDGGGLYRTEAIASIGYFSDRNLGSFEEFDLAARLESAGWRLARIDAPAVLHAGYSANGYRMIYDRLRWGQFSGSGQVLRAALGRRHFGFVLHRLSHVRIIIAIIGWWLSLILNIIFLPILLVPLTLAPLLMLIWRRRSIALGLYSFCYWNVNAIGAVFGFFKRRTPPNRPLAWVEISDVDHFSTQPYD